MIITFPRAAKFVLAMAALGAMLVSPITAQAQSDIVGSNGLRGKRISRHLELTLALSTYPGRHPG